MSDRESIKKMLRSVLQSSKTGVSVNSLQSEYRSLCGENIPLKKLGYSKLEDYLKSIPSVARLEYRMGELKCFAAVCQETAHIAELVAKQKNSKKSGRSQVVNCRMRFKPSNPYMLNGRRHLNTQLCFLHQGSIYPKLKPFVLVTGEVIYCLLMSAFVNLSSSSYTNISQRSLLKKSPELTNQRYRKTLHCILCCKSKSKSKLSCIAILLCVYVELRKKQALLASCLYDVELVQSRLIQLMEKYYSGLWMSKLSQVYSEMFNQKLHPQALVDLEKWTHICMELIGLQSLSFSHTRTCPASTNAPPLASSLQPGPDILPLLKVTFSPTSDSAPRPTSKSPAVVSAEARQRIKELLSKYSHGLWAHALPKLFMDTYKMSFPEHIMDNLSLLLDICTVEYPMPHDKKKAILYNSFKVDMEDTDNQKSQKCRSTPLPSGLEVLGSVEPPYLALPSEQYPSVLITDAKSSNAVTVRYVGENYSNAQEAMEGTMHSFYSQSSTHRPLSNPVVGQLVAVKGEDGDDLARAQVMKVMPPNKVKVYYVDYGFSVETSGTNLLELHQDFLSLPFQATNVQLAGLDAFSSHPLVLSSLDKLAVGKILLMETLEPCQKNEIPEAVLYDTSQDDDVNINSTCLKALQDNTMNNPLTVNATCQEVCVTNVCADGIIYCQLPSRGTARLSKLLEDTEAFFTSKMTSELLVSRPFSGKFCLARYKGKWSRVEITNMYGNRVMEILFIDLGLPATVEVTDLREIPPLFLKDFTIIPPQAIKCRLADLTVPEGDWRPEAVLWVKEALLGSEDCKMRILKLDRHKGDWLVYMYLFVGADSQELDKSINRQLAQSELWHKLTTQNNNTITKCLHQPKRSEYSTKPHIHFIFPVFFQPGQNIDVFVPVACHPGYFVLQLWQDLHKLVVLMGEMILYYNQTRKANTATNIQKGEVYAARIDKNWHRVQVKGVLANGLVSVYDLDYGKHELVRTTLLQPLIEEFRQLPFQAITAQLAGVTQHQWSEEASMLFRNHVEDRALVAQVESVQEVSEVKGELWERRLTVYLVDTAVEDRDIWIHSIMADISGDLSSAA
uniref:Tudor domain containing 7 a n=1 Tax=Dicentrarchus labrax TaxID=13489 RepID=A0A8C4DZA1_DICLA